MCMFEKLSFDAYNESVVLKAAIENYKQRTGHYPERILVDQIYRNRDNITFCSNLGIHLSGKKLGRSKKDVDAKADSKTAYQDNTDRIEVERKFSLAKRKFGGYWSATHKKRRYNKSINRPQHHCNEPRPTHDIAFSFSQICLALQA